MDFKKILASLLAAIMFLSCVPMSGLAQFDLFSTSASAEEGTLAPSGQCGSNINWTFDSESGLLTLSGTGKTYYYSSSNGSVFYNKACIKSVVVGEGITGLDYNLFRNCAEIVSVTLPNSLKEISRAVFAYCTKLTDINLPCNLETIGLEAFMNCSSLSSINIPDSVSSVGEQAFYKTGIYNNSSTWENDVLYVDSCLVEAKKTIAGAYDVKDGTKIIATAAFAQCKNLTGVNLPDSLKYINKSAFEKCDKLTEITIGKGVTNIGNSAFDSCTSLEKAVISDSVTHIGLYAFYNCQKLSSVKLGSNVKTISAQAFDNCISLKKIEIPASVTSLYNDSFSRCTSLESITVDENNTTFDSRNNCDAIIRTSSNSLIVGCKSTVIPEDVISLGIKAFNGVTGLTAINIPKSVQVINDSAFYSCTGLSEIILGNGIVSIYDNAFPYNEITPIDVYFRGTQEQWNELKIVVTSTAKKWINSVNIHYNYELETGNCGENAQWIFDKEDGSLYIIGNGAMDNNDRFVDYEWMPYQNEITYVDVADGIENIGSFAFAGCTKLKEVYLGDTAKSVGENAFNGCDLLNAITVTADGFSSQEKFSSCGENLVFVTDSTNTKTLETLKAGGYKAITYTVAEKEIPTLENKVMTLSFDNQISIYNSGSYNYLTNILNKYSDSEFFYFEKLVFEDIKNDSLTIDEFDCLDEKADKITLTHLYVNISVLSNSEEKEVSFAEMIDLLRSGNYDAFKVNFKSDEIDGSKTVFEKIADFFESIATNALKAISKAINFITGIFKRK